MYEIILISFLSLDDETPHIRKLVFKGEHTLT